MKRGILACCALVALLVTAAAAQAAPAIGGVDFAVGAGTFTQLGGQERFAVGAYSGSHGEHPQGFVVVSNDTQGTFHGDVSKGCLVANGNRAIAVGKLPASEQFTVPGAGFLIQYVAVIVTDNGRPRAGHSVDTAADALLQQSSADLLCAGHVNPGLVERPLDNGDTVVHDAP